MADEQRQQIKMLRYQGYGYKQIASEVGLSRDAVRGYCIRNGLQGLETCLAKEYKQVMQKDFLFVLCPNCGRQIEQNQNGTKKNIAHRNVKENGRKFIEKHSNNKNQK